MMSLDELYQTNKNFFEIKKTRTRKSQINKGEYKV